MPGEYLDMIGQGSQTWLKYNTVRSLPFSLNFMDQLVSKTTNNSNKGNFHDFRIAGAGHMKPKQSHLSLMHALLAILIISVFQNDY